MRTPLYLKSTLIVLAILGGDSCVSRRSIEPEPIAFTLYAAIVRIGDDLQRSVIAFDAETYEEFDTLLTSSTDLGGMSIDRDGTYMAFNRPSGAELWSVSPFERIGATFSRSLEPVFLHDTNLIIAPDFDSTLVFSIPSLNQHQSWPLELWWPVVIPNENAVIGVTDYGDHASPGPDRLLVYDYVQGEVIDSAFTANDDITGFLTRRIAVSPDGDRVYSLGFGGGGPGVIGYDLRVHRTLFRQPIASVIGDVRVSPGGDEVWVTDPGSSTPLHPEGPGYILAIDAFSGVVLDTIRTEGYDPDGVGPIFVREIRFHSGGKTAFVSGGAALRGGGPIMVINVATREIIRLLLDDFLDSPYSIHIAPTPS